MKGVPATVAALSFAFVTLPAAQVQDRAGQHSCLNKLIQARLLAQQPVRLSAETLTLTGDTLRLVGRATVRFDDTTIRFQEIVLNQSSKRIEFLGNGRIFLGTESPCMGPVPKIEFR
jgi:lipopolysaccharide assembly outer membrane protein LptD (OstA)